MELTPEIIRELLKYDPITGVLLWRHRDAKWFTSERMQKTWNTRYANKEAFTTTGIDGYKIGSIFNKSRRAHIVAWANFYGEWPIGEIDHIDHDRANNKIDNLRDISSYDNRKNQSLASNNTSGHIGVYWNKRSKKWHSQIWTNGDKKHLGLFVNKDDAVIAREKAELKYGFHENHGRDT